MTAPDVPLLLAALVLVLLAGVLAMLEAAFSRVSRVTVEELVREERPGADRLQDVMADPARFLNVLLLLRLACELLATALVTLVCLDLLVPWQAVPLAAAAMTVVSYVFVGVGPRTLGRQHATPVALRGAGMTLVLTRLLGPLPPLLILVGNAVTPGRGFREGPFASEAELRDMVDLAEESKVIEHGAREMIHSVFELGETLARGVMVPRTEMVFVEAHKSVRQAVNLCLRSGFSRLPVVGENQDDVVGIAYLKDLVRRSLRTDEQDEPPRVDDAMRAATFVPDSKPADALLREMQAGRIHIAVVVDEYGGTAGLVTIEDILEEIVGEITDEYDRELPPVERIDADTVRVLARLPVDDLNDLFDVHLEDEDVETVSGLMAKALGRVPIPGARVEVGGLQLLAESAGGRRNRLGTVLVHRGSDADGDGAAGAGTATRPGHQEELRDRT